MRSANHDQETSQDVTGFRFFAPSTSDQAPEAVIALLDEWLQDESGYDEETWPELKKALDRDRLSERKLFDA